MDYLWIGLIACAALWWASGLLPMKAVRLQFGELLAADATTLAPAVNANEVMLVANNVAIDENKVIGDLTAATFTGSANIVGVAGAQLAGIDPATGDQLIQIKAPAGGWRWECTVAPGAPETIYALALVTTGGAALLALQPIESVVIANVGDVVMGGDLIMRMVAQPAS